MSNVKVQIYVVIPVLARQSASARRRANGNPVKEKWIPAFAGMTGKDRTFNIWVSLAFGFPLSFGF
jgi:hypothetical protein